MATKAQVISVLTKQAIAEWEIEKHEPFTFSAWLPEEYIWDSGNDLGLVTQEKMEDESMSQFWDNILAVIDAPVIKKEQN